MNKVLLTLGLAVVTLSAQASEDTQYVRLTKGMVVNYGEPSLDRLKYLKIAVDVRVPNAENAELVEHHLPALLDSLVLVFAGSEEETVRTGMGKEEIRQLALEKVQSVMKAEEGDSIVEDLLFSTFVVQR